MNARKSCVVRINHFIWMCPSFQIDFFVAFSVMFWKTPATPSNCWEVGHTPLTHFHFSLAAVRGLLSIENTPAGHSRWTNCGCHVDESIYLLDKASELIGLDKEWARPSGAVWPVKVFYHKEGSSLCWLLAEIASPDHSLQLFVLGLCCHLIAFQLFVCIIQKSKAIMLHLYGHTGWS